MRAFQTLDEQIATTEGGRPTVRVRLVRFAGIAVIGIGLVRVI